MNLRIDTPVTTPIWNATPFDEMEKVTRKKTSPYPKDSLQETVEAKQAWGFISPEIAATMLGPRYFVESETAHHKLEAPQINASAFTKAFREIEQQLMPKVLEKDDSENANLRENTLLLLYIACMKTHQSNRKEGTSLTYDTVQKKQETNKQLMTEYFDKLDETISRNKTNEVLDLVSWAVWGGIVAAGVASIAVTVATGGAALPTVLIVVNAALGFGSGSVAITQGVLNYQNDLDSGKMLVMETDRYINSEKIREGMDEMKQSMDEIARTWEQLSEVLENLRKAATAK